jgi:hypothetical protein
VHSRVSYSESLRVGNLGPGSLLGDALGGNSGGSIPGVRLINTVGNSGIAGLNLSMSNDMDSLDMLSPSHRQSQDGVDEQYVGQLSSGYYAHSQPQSRTVVLLQPGQGQGQGLIGGPEPSMKKKNHNNNNNSNHHHNHSGVTYNMNNNNNNNNNINSNGSLNTSNQASRAPRNQTQIQNPNFQQQRTNSQRQRQMTSGSGQGQGQGNFVSMNNIDVLNPSSFNSPGAMLSDHRGSLSSHSHITSVSASAALGAGLDTSVCVTGTGSGTGDNFCVNSEISSGSPQKRGRRDFQLSDNSLINIQTDRNRTNMTDRKKNTHPHPPTAQSDISSTSISTTVMSNVRRYCKDDEKMIEIDAKSY